MWPFVALAAIIGGAIWAQSWPIGIVGVICCGIWAQMALTGMKRRHATKVKESTKIDKECTATDPYVLFSKDDASVILVYAKEKFEHAIRRLPKEDIMRFAYEQDTSIDNKLKRSCTTTIQIRDVNNPTVRIKSPSVRVADEFHATMDVFLNG